MSMDFRGDPASALLEVLDPEQNSTFNDHYLDLDYDLSDVMFITTANQQHAIPLPLQDRLEIIELPGYTEWEKVAIAKQYLIPKQAENNGVKDLKITWTDEALTAIIHRYTKEAGVRNFEREIATVCRKIAKEWLAGGRQAEQAFEVTPEKLTVWLGVEKYREARREKEDEIGLANGLAVTAFGGDLLTAEVTIVPGKGKLTLTGKLGEVMQESAQAAMSYLRSRAGTFGLSNDFQNKVDIHVHFPEGAIPKDGPSAGITMATAMASALLRIPVRQTVAMTGEVTLRGRVLPIGGLKEKILAAHRAGVETVLIPEENRKDLKDVPESVLEQIAVLPVKHMDEVLRHALAHPQPDEFLREPSSVVDWRIVETMPPTDPRDAH
jgi:ATP-dependent Lon protease